MNYDWRKEEPDLARHHFKYADEDGLSWWAVRKPRAPMFNETATGFISAKPLGMGAYLVQAGPGTPTITNADMLALWEEWAPADGWYGNAVPWPDRVRSEAPELSER